MQLRRVDAWILGFALLIAAVFGLSRAVLRLTAPSDGALVGYGAFRAKDGGAAVYLINGAKTELQNGDIVQAINGRSLDDWAFDAKYFRASSPPADAPMTYTITRAGETLTVQVTPRGFLRRRLTEDWPNVLSAFVYLGIGVYVFVRRAKLPAARALLALGVTMFCVNIFRAYDLEATDFLQARLYGWAVIMLTLIAPHVYSAMLHFALTFPAPNPLIERHRWALPSLYAAIALIYLALNYGVLPRLAIDELAAYFSMWRVNHGVSVVIMLTVLALGAINSRRARSELERQQWLIVFGGGALAIVANVLISGLPQFFNSRWRTPTGWLPLTELAFPLALAIAVSRYRLFDIGTLVNRALVYGLLSMMVIGVYAIMLLGIGVLLDIQENPWFMLLTAGIVAVALHPLRQWLQKNVDRRMYGQRNDPYQALTQLGQQLGAAQEARSALHAAAESVTRALNVPYAAIAVSGGALLAESGNAQTGGGALTRWPLVYQGETVGEVRAADRLPGEALTEGDRRLIEDMLPQITLAANNARLTYDLQESRQRAIGLLEDERRRLRRDLHDGLGPTLAAMMLNLDTALSRIQKGAPSESISALLTESRAMSESALADVRRVAYNLRPPALDDLGLTGALRQHADRLSLEAGLTITVDSALGTRALPAAVEVAAFRIVTEALTNVVRHAHARHAAVVLRVEDGTDGSHLSVMVTDDGAGLPRDARMGVGLRAMRERAAELDGALNIEALHTGGTRVWARLPLGE